MTPQELAAAEHQARLIGTNSASEMKQIAMGVHADVMAKVFAELLGKWLELNAFASPTPNDLRWLARVAHRYSWYVPETMGMCKLSEDHLAALSGLKEDNILSFEHLFSVPPKSPVEQP
jgi:hypothetical protein